MMATFILLLFYLNFEQTILNSEIGENLFGGADSDKEITSDNSKTE